MLSFNEFSIASGDFDDLDTPLKVIFFAEKPSSFLDQDWQETGLLWWFLILLPIAGFVVTALLYFAGRFCIKKICGDLKYKPKRFWKFGVQPVWVEQPVAFVDDDQGDMLSEQISRQPHVSAQTPQQQFGGSLVRPSQQQFGGGLVRPSQQQFGGALARPSQQQFGGGLARPSQQQFGGALGRPSQQQFGGTMSHHSQQQMGGVLARPSQQQFGSTPSQMVNIMGQQSQMQQQMFIADPQEALRLVSLLLM